MGVSGVGKSTVAQRLAADLGLELAEGDDFHPRSNHDTMSSGQPLTDEAAGPGSRRSPTGPRNVVRRDGTPC